MRYVVARLESEYRETSYRVYHTDVLRALANVPDRWIEMVMKPAPKEEEQTAEEIIADVVSKLGIKIG